MENCSLVSVGAIWQGYRQWSCCDTGVGSDYGFKDLLDFYNFDPLFRRLIANVVLVHFDLKILQKDQVGQSPNVAEGIFLSSVLEIVEMLSACMVPPM